MQLQTLYARTTTGAVQEWTIEIVDGKFRTHHGQVGGKITTTQWTTAQETNAGRANMRTASEQALFEAQALWKKKKDSGSFEDINDVDKQTFVEPMLAKKWEDFSDAISYPVYTQAKLDGCLRGDSLIELDGEKVEIQNLFTRYIKGGDLPKIRTYNERTGCDEYKNVKVVMRNGVDINEKSYTWYKITTECGKVLTLTGNHRVWVDNLKCWRRCDELDGTEILKSPSSFA